MKIEIPGPLLQRPERASLCSLACQAAYEAGQFIHRLYEKPHTIKMKGPIDLVTEADVGAERIILDLLRHHTPDIPVLAEESTPVLDSPSDRQWVVDPLDGTTNFAHGFPFFAVSIALVELGQPIVAAIYAPVFNELFLACRGCGAWLNNRPLSVTHTAQLIEALVGTGFPYDIEHTLEDVLTMIGSVLPKVRDIRRAGAAALDLAYVACGRLDGFYEINLQPWDTAAGWLLVEEAGGKITDFDGGSYSINKQQIVATNGLLHPLLLPLLG